MSPTDITGIEEGYRESDDRYKKGTSDHEDGTSFCNSATVVAITQKVIAEVVGTYFVMFVGCGTVVVNKIYDGSVTFPGICIAWGLIVMVMIYSVGHISGAHFNPAVTITFAIFRQFPYKQVPLYMIAQLLGSILASVTLCVVLDVNKEAYFGTIPAGSNLQSLVMEFITTFLLMFVVSGVATDNRSVGELAGIAIGMTILVDVLVAGPVSGASMNPTRSIGPALVMQEFKGIWVYMIGPPLGAIAGGFTYNLIRFTDKPFAEITKAQTFLKSATDKPFAEITKAQTFLKSASSSTF